jgi:hypothetical protein
MREVMMVVVTGKIVGLEDVGVVDEVEAGEEDTMMVGTIVKTIGIVIEVADTMMITADAAGAADVVVDMEADMEETDTITEAPVEGEDMGVHLDPLDPHPHLIWDMVTVQATQSPDMGHRHLLLLLL